MASQDAVLSSGASKRASGLAVAAAWLVVCALAAGFIYLYVFHYYLNFGPKGFEVYWPRRWGLLAHISAGMVALVIGPFQFWTGLRSRLPKVHRWTGRIYLAAVAVGSLAGLYMAATTTFGWPFGFALAMLALAWAGTAGVAYAAILNGAVALHRRWMVRAYVVTFAFVTFRLINDWLPTSQIKPPGELAVADAWACWVVPLMVTMFIQGLQDARRQGRRRG
jgi:uncharacterized membrane protein